MRTPSVGVIGVEIFRDWFVTIDLAAGYIDLRPPKGESGSALEESEDSTVVPITVHNDMAWLPVRYQDGKPASHGNRHAPLRHARRRDGVRRAGPAGGGHRAAARRG